MLENTTSTVACEGWRKPGESWSRTKRYPGIILQSDFWGGARHVDGPCNHNEESYRSFPSFGAYAEVKLEVCFGRLGLCPARAFRALPRVSGYSLQTESSTSSRRSLRIFSSSRMQWRRCVEAYRRAWLTFCIHFHGRRALLTSLGSLFLSLQTCPYHLVVPWRCKQHVHPKRRQISTRLDGITPQKDIFGLWNQIWDSFYKLQ